MITSGLALIKLRSDYLEARPPLKSEYLLSLLLGSPDLVYEWTVGNDVKYSPPIQYMISYVKFIIKKIEDLTLLADPNSEETDEFPLEIWYTCLQRLSSSPCLSEPFYRLYNISKSEEEMLVKIYENESAFVSDGTTGLITWEASVEFIKWFQEDDNPVKDTNWIIELGCGCGLLAIAVLKLTTDLNSYIATDGSTTAVCKCRHNFESNFECPPPVSFEVFDWTSRNDMAAFERIVLENTRRFGGGYLIGADVVFDIGLIPSLVKFICRFLEIQNQLSNPGKVVLSCTARNELTVKHLTDQLGNSTSICSSTRISTWENGFILLVE